MTKDDIIKRLKTDLYNLLQYRGHRNHCEVEMTETCTCGMAGVARRAREALELEVEKPTIPPRPSNLEILHAWHDWWNTYGYNWWKFRRASNNPIDHTVPLFDHTESIEAKIDKWKEWWVNVGINWYVWGGYKKEEAPSFVQARSRFYNI